MLTLLRIFLLTLFTTVTLPGGCLSAQAQPPTKTAAAADEKALTVFPNPSTGIVHININGFEGRKLELRVLNVIGTVMYRESLTELRDRYTRTLDLSKFANGLYYVKLEADNASEMRKLVIR
ncbi:T9SS type A sorting domain-containing protein [Hymenobacter aerophilus]|uniref:T9SS type A sorting domain-containing protein n=1 Tax=Hymenobacter aerophilus TaxID=119644 RepID=UPI0009FBCE2E|nr:T9SS type A sorting domain-containing protein [Hymenobacter aerophilus]